MSLCCVSLYSNRNVLEPRGGRTVSANVSEQTDHWGCRLDAQSFSREFSTCSAFLLKVVLRVEATEKRLLLLLLSTNDSLCQDSNRQPSDVHIWTVGPSEVGTGSLSLPYSRTYDDKQNIFVVEKRVSMRRRFRAAGVCSKRQSIRQMKYCSTCPV